VRAFVVDAFTDRAFRGNPAGVVFLDEPAEAEWLQAVAAELKHSETAFVRRRADGDYDLRWFTPAVEVNLCGHATLATTHVLAGFGAGSTFTFHTRSGALLAAVEPDGAIALDFPAQPPHPVAEPAGLATALGVPVVSTHSNGVDVLAELADESTVADLAPDIAALRQVECRGVTVTAAADQDGDFVSRFFAPRVGVDEDPVTGSAHTMLTPFWAARLGRTTLSARQLSPRGGRLGVELRGDRVVLRGRAVTVLDGALRE
jgi:PhzF family phenazine biosynthesis protein